MVFKGILTATAAVALMAAPTVAAAQTAPAPAPTTERVEGDAVFGQGGFIIPLLAVAAIVLGILAATSGGDDDRPVTP